jgi:hypothetical protein
MRSMRFNRNVWILSILLVVLALLSGCTAPQVPAIPSPATPAAASSTGMQAAAPASTMAAVKTADIDTTINVHYGDFACLNVQNVLGTAYLYPDEKFRLSAASPGVSNVNVNVLFLDENDSLGIRQVKPVWDSVQKKWVYEGIVPVVQFNDITTPVDKIFTIKTQSKYYICVDDRKEIGVNDVMLRVPVKLQRL